MTSPPLHPIAQALAAGNQRFLTGQSAQSSQSSLARLKEFADKGQLPKAIVLCCSDSRAPVEIIFDQDIGDLFVIRVAGNIVAPSLIGSVEYAIDAFGTTLVIVMGHTGCGAVVATLGHITNAGDIPSDNINHIIKRIKPHILAIAALPLTYEAKLAQAVVANVHASVSELAHGSPVIEQLVQQGSLTILGAMLELRTGLVSFLAPSTTTKADALPPFAR